MKIGIWIILLVLVTSCKNDVEFDSKVWNKKKVDWQVTESREKMVADLIASDTLIGLNKPEIFKLIGKPEIENDKNLKFRVREKYGWNIDPEYIKYLCVDLDENGITTKCYLEKIK